VRCAAAQHAAALAAHVLRRLRADPLGRQRGEQGTLPARAPAAPGRPRARRARGHARLLLRAGGSRRGAAARLQRHPALSRTVRRGRLRGGAPGPPQR
jgi:hypothetical protein